MAQVFGHILGNLAVKKPAGSESVVTCSSINIFIHVGQIGPREIHDSPLNRYTISCTLVRGIVPSCVARFGSMYYDNAAA